jgi:hypothetical protein
MAYTPAVAGSFYRSQRRHAVKEFFMAHRDAEISEVIVVLQAAFAEKMVEAVGRLEVAGLEVDSIVEDEGVVNGEIETRKIPDLQKLDCVNFVRTVMTYIADYPVGDPRDRDLVEDDDEDTAEAV